MGHPLARLFSYAHLSPELQEVSAPFADLASILMYGEDGNEQATNKALWKLWEAKNCAVLAASMRLYG